jgi:hypothetical protein
MDALPNASRPEEVGPLYDEIRGQLDGKPMAELRKLAKAVRVKPARGKFLTVTRIMEVWLNTQREAVGKEKPPPPKEEKGGDPPPEADLFDRAELHRRIEREVKGLDVDSPVAYAYQRIKKMNSRKQIQLYHNLRFDFAGMRHAFGDPGIELAKLEIAKRLVEAVAHIPSRKQQLGLRLSLGLRLGLCLCLWLRLFNWLFERLRLVERLRLFERLQLFERLLLFDIGSRDTSQ